MSVPDPDIAAPAVPAVPAPVAVVEVPAPAAPAPVAAPVTASPAPRPAFVPKPRRDWARWAGLGVAVILGVALLTPLFLSPWYSSHETNRYMIRLYEFIRGWKDWQIFPRWAPDTYGGFGSPLFVFCSGGLFALAAPFYFVGATLAIALKIAVVLITIAGASGAYLLAYGESRRADASLLAAAAWVFAPYRFVDLYVRGDLAEYMAVCLFPLVVWLYREVGRVPREKIARTATWAALCHAAIIYAHTISGQWDTELLFLLVLPTVFACLFNGDYGRFLAFGFTFAFALALGAAYLVPALHDKGYSQTGVDQVTTGYATSTGHLVPFDLFFRFGYFDFVGDGMLGDSNRMPFSIGVPAAAALAIALGALIWRLPISRKLLLWLCAIGGLLFLMTPQAIALWPLLPFSKFIQFPWRLIGPVMGLSVALIALCWAAVIPSPRVGFVLCVAVIATMAYDARRFVKEAGGDYIPLDISAIQLGVDQGLDDIPPGTPPSVRPSSLVTTTGRVHANALQPRASEYDISVEAAGPGKVELQSFWFPCWKIIEQQGPAGITMDRAPNALLRLSIPAAGSYRLRVAFRPALLYWLGEILSMLALVLLWPTMRFITRERRRSSPPLVPSAAAA